MFGPGTDWGYSSSGYVLLGYIIEQVTGKTYEEVIDQYIFEPLEMKNSGYDHPRTILKNRATGYGREKEVFLNAIHFEMDTPHAAGALYSTIEDLFLWDQALYTTRLVSQETLDIIFTQHAQSGYGYGWFVGEFLKRNRVGHSGGISGFRTNYYRFPDEKACIIALSNFEQVNIFKINENLAAILFNEKYELPKKFIKDTLYQIITQKDVASAINHFYEFKDKHPEDYDYGKYQLNWLAQELLDSDMLDEAIEIYKWIIEMYPDGWEDYMHIADVYMIRGDKELAIKYYARSLEMNPKIWYAKMVSEAMKKLTEQDD